MPNDKKYPQPVEQVIHEEGFKEEITDSKGKKHIIKGKNQTTVPENAETLYKLGQMIYVSPESKKVYFIPFTIQFSFEEFIKWLINIQKRLEEVAELWSKDQEKQS